MVVLGLAGLAIAKARPFIAARFPAAKERVDKVRERIEPALRDAADTVASAIGEAATGESSDALGTRNPRVTSSSN
jgi:hypothetical protein